jgi:glycosyltransferase involved in cell wall biosynthesis
LETKPKISLVTATFNSASVLKSCLDSICSQQHNSVEHLIIDGGSTDNTQLLIKDYQNNYQNIDIKFISEPDQGIYDALNKGIQKATGDIIGFVHSDDALASKDTLKNIAKAFYENDVYGVYGDLHYVAADNPNKILRNWVSQPFSAKLLKKGWMPAHPTLFLRKEIYEQFGGFDLSYKIAADYEFILRVFKHKQLSFYYLPEVITKMRWGGASNKSLKNILQKSAEDYRALKTHNIGIPWMILLQKNLSKISQFFLK